MESRNKEPYPVERMALALAFSPRMEALLSEARRLKWLFNTHLYIIHVGKHTNKEELYLNQVLHRFGLDDPRTTVIWKQGEPVKEILQVCNELDIDLLIAGALERENIFRYFLGSIARDICRRAKCSVLMLTEPAINPKHFRKIVVSGIDHPKTRYTVGMATYIGNLECSDEVTIVLESQLASIAGTIEEGQQGDGRNAYKNEIVQEQKKELEEIISQTDCENLTVKSIYGEGKPGFCATNYAREHEVDLLVISSPDRQLGFLDRVFPYDLEYALANLPCNLLIVHSNISHDQA